MPRQYQKPTAKTQNRVYRLHKKEDMDTCICFFVVRLDLGIPKSYNHGIVSWVTLKEGTRYPTYELAYKELVRFSNCQHGQYKVMSLKEVEEYGFI